MRSNPISVAVLGIRPAHLLFLTSCFVFGLTFISLESTTAQASDADAAATKLLEVAGPVSEGFMIAAFYGRGPEDKARAEELLGHLSLEEAEAAFEEFIETRIVPIVADHFDESELTALIGFFESPVGQRLIEKLPEISLESQEASPLWWDEFERRNRQASWESENRPRSKESPSTIVIPAEDLPPGTDDEDFVAFDTPPEAVHMIAAKYPESARLNMEEGTVQLLVTIDEEGKVTNVSVHESDAVPSLEQSAIDAAYEWKFKPAFQKETPVKVRIVIPFRFSLN